MTPRTRARILVLVGSNDDASNVYYDVLNQRMYTFDHLDNTVVSEEEFQDGAVLEEDMKQLRDSLIQKSRMYIKELLFKTLRSIVRVDVGCDG